jgi:hypothetical protein
MFSFRDVIWFLMMLALAVGWLLPDYLRHRR